MKIYTLPPEDVKNDPTVLKMIDRRNLSSASERTYLMGIRFFCNYYKESPEKLIERFSAMSEDELVDQFGDFFAKQSDRVAPKSMKTWMPGIKAWMLENGIRSVDRVSREISREFKRKIGKPTKLLKRDSIEKDEIIQILKICKKRERAIICTFASSGLRLSACLGLQMKHVKDDIWDPNLKSYLLEIHGNLLKGTDKAEPHFTYISQESAEYIRDLLTDRIDLGENITSNSYLFKTEDNSSQLSPKRFSNLWRQLCKRAGIDMRAVPIVGYQPKQTKGGKIKLDQNGIRYNIRVHSLRKFFKTACSMNSVDRMASESFLGHSLTQFGIESVYDYAYTKKDWLRDEYQKALNTITFLKPAPIVSAVNGKAREKIVVLEAENEILKIKLNDLDTKIDEYRNLFIEVLNNPEALKETKRRLTK